MPSFLIGSSSHLQVTRTGIKSRRSLNSVKIRQFTELLALEHFKNVVNTIYSAFIFDRIFKLAGNEDRHIISDKFDFGPDGNISFNNRSYLPLSNENISHIFIMEKML